MTLVRDGTFQAKLDGVRADFEGDVGRTMKATRDLPLVGLTMGDVAGVGPEVIARAWLDPALHALARPVVLGDPGVLERALKLVDGGDAIRIHVVAAPEETLPSPATIPCLPVAGG